MNRPETGIPSSDGRWADAISRADDLIRRERSSGPEEPRPLPGQRVVMILAGLAVAVAVAWVSPRVVPGSPVQLSSSDQASDLRAEVAHLVEEIEAYREEYGRLPAPEMLTPFLDEGYRYRILDPTVGQYEVRRSAGGVEVTYDGTLPVGLWLLLGGANAEARR